jgi:hypothetical protein
MSVCNIRLRRNCWKIRGAFDAALTAASKLPRNYRQWPTWRTFGEVHFKVGDRTENGPAGATWVQTGVHLPEFKKLSRN